MGRVREKVSANPLLKLIPELNELSAPIIQILFRLLSWAWRKPAASQRTTAETNKPDLLSIILLKLKAFGLQHTDFERTFTKKRQSSARSIETCFHCAGLLCGLCAYSLRLNINFP